jgi:hypothetical protein
MLRMPKCSERKVTRHGSFRPSNMVQSCRTPEMRVPHKCAQAGESVTANVGAPPSFSFVNPTL